MKRAVEVIPQGMSNLPSSVRIGLGFKKYQVYYIHNFWGSNFRTNSGRIEF
jgi:hypothetical protein